MDVSTFYQSSMDELFDIIISTLSQFAAEIVDDEGFKEFSKYISELQIVLKELQSKRVENRMNSDSTRTALESLDSHLKKAYSIMKGYKSGSRLVLLLNTRTVFSQMQQLTKEIAEAVSLLSLTSLDSTLNLKSKIALVVNDLQSLEFKSAARRESIVSEMERALRENGRNRDRSANLLHKIAEALGVTANPSLLQQELTLVKQEKEKMEAQKMKAEALQLSQLIQLLNSMEMDCAERRAISRGASDNHQYLITSFTCPLCNEIMEDPVTIACGHSFEKKAIEERLADGDKTCPTCKQELPFLELTPNISLRNSIQEWKQRSMDFMLINAVSGVASDDPSTLNQALEDLQVLMEKPHFRYIVAEKGLITRIVASMKVASVNTKVALKCLYYLAIESDSNKEAIVEAGTIRCIVKQFYKGEADFNAVAVLQELSENETIAEKIGNAKDCIPFLVSLLNSNSRDILQKAERALHNLSSNIHFVIKMAEAGHFPPFAARFSQGTLEAKTSMATALVQMQLNHHNRKELEHKTFIGALTQMLLSSSPACKFACLQCMRKLLAFPKMAKYFLADRTTIPGLLGLVGFASTEAHLKKTAGEVLTALVRDAQLSEIETTPHLQELQTEHNIGIFLQLTASSEAQTRTQFLKLLVALCHKSKEARSLVRSDEPGVSRLFSYLDPSQPDTVRQQTLELIHCIAQESPTGISLPASTSGKESAVKMLVAILTSSPDINERSTAAGLIGWLPTNDPTLNDILCKSDALKAIRQVICELDDGSRSSTTSDSAASLLENALSALLRFTEPANPVLRRQVSELELCPSLVRVLSTGTSLAKERTAIALTHLSESSTVPPEGSDTATPDAFTGTFVPLLQLSRSFSNVGWCCSAQRPSLCPVHGDTCSSQTVCLVKVNAVGPLVRALSETKTGVAGAAIRALDTLMKDESTRADAAKAIVKCQGVQAVLDVLEKGDTPAREKALELFHKVYANSEIARAQSQRSQCILIQLLQDDPLKKKAAHLLSEMGVIPMQSSYF